MAFSVCREVDRTESSEKCGSEDRIDRLVLCNFSSLCKPCGRPVSLGHRETLADFESLSGFPGRLSAQSDHAETPGSDFQESGIGAPESIEKSETSSSPSSAKTGETPRHTSGPGSFRLAALL